MKPLVSALLWIAIWLPCSPLASPLRAAEVAWVADGDTIVLKDGRHIRYIGINAPEIPHKDKAGEPFGEAAKQFNATLVLNKAVRLVLDRETFDRYGRVLAYVFLPDGELVNRTMLANGLAYCLYRAPNIRYHRQFLSVQRTAMSEQTGIWQLLKEKSDPYMGNRVSRRFHTLDCPFGKTMKAANRIFFNTLREAFWAGYAPCRRCMPAK